MKGLQTFNDVIEYIESRLDKDLSVEEMAKRAQTSVYEFRRIFSFIAGTPISEYVRKRRLSKAAEELAEGNKSVTEIGAKYGYDTPSSFTRAFKAFHGVSPTEIGKTPLRMYTKITFDFQAKGGGEIDYTLTDEPAFYVCGYSGVSDLNDTECCEAVWSEFYETEKGKRALELCENQLYAAYANGEDSVVCSIGAKRTEALKGLDCVYVPPCKWAKFSLRGSADETVNAFYKNVIFGWLASGSYERDETVPNLEIFPKNMDSDDFSWEIAIPVKRK